MKLMLPDLCTDPGAGSILQPLANVLRGGIEDKIAQVFLSTLGLLDAACKEFEAARLNTHMVCVWCPQNDAPR